MSIKYTIDRRRFLSLLSASGGALLFNRCKPPRQKIIPYTKPVEYIKPGMPVLYSSVFCHKNAAFGIVITTRDGRPIRIDGNENHPSNRGTSSHLIQASIFDLYNPVRLNIPIVNKKKVTLQNALDYIKNKIEDIIRDNGNIRIVIDEQCSPTYSRMIDEIEKLFPQVKFITYPAIRSIEPKINSELFEINGEIVPDFGKINQVVSVGKDFLGTDKLSLYYQTQFANIKKVNKNFSITTIEPAVTLTGANSNKHFLIQPDYYELFLILILIKVIQNKPNNRFQAILDQCKKISEIYLQSDSKYYYELLQHSETITDGLLINHGSSLVWGGSYLSRTAFALTVIINHILGNIGEGKPLNPDFILPNSSEKFTEIEILYDEIINSKIDILILGDTNLFYYADNRFRAALENYPSDKLISFSLYPDETTFASSVFVPVTHYLESWGDAITFDGIYSIKQPVILPLNKHSISFEDFLFQQFIQSTINHKQKNISSDKEIDENGNLKSYYDYLKSNLLRMAGSEVAARQILKNGVYKTESNYKNNFIFNQEKLIDILSTFNWHPQTKLKCVISPSYTKYDGTFSENKLLNELPDPITKISWQPFARINENFAKENNLSDGDIIQISRNNSSLELPVSIQPLIAENTISLNFGYGKFNSSTEFYKSENAFILLESWDETEALKGIKLQKTNKKVKLALVQSVEYLDKKQDLFNNFNFLKKKEYNEEKSINKKNDYSRHKWGMTINLELCTGCQSCVLSCQIENNIPVIGIDEILKGRQINWIRIDRYYNKNQTDERSLNEINTKPIYFLPVLCQHCENAPCESVCPVSASTHSPEGLNETTYNRCIGSRYCILNCPYNVRKFNYLDYSNQFKKPLNYGLNPNVTVRSRGVVEKCTFCIQRINESKYRANDEGRDQIPEGSIKTACQQACPSDAIIFGNLNDNKSSVNDLAKSTRSFHLLEELNTKPSILYIL